jgi:hypothetical protein
MARIKIRTPAQLRTLARQQIGEEIRGALAPLRRGQRETMSRRTAVLADLDRLFGGVQPFVSQSAANQAALARETTAMQKGLFDQVANQMAGFRQQQASEAQMLAQELGGPVPVEPFTEPVGMMQRASAELGAGAMLQSSALGQAGAAEAETFAGQVFPAMRTAATTGAIRESEEEIANILEEIRNVQAGRPGKEASRFQELLKAEREAQVAQTGLDIEFLKEKHNYELARRSAGLAERQLGLERFRTKAEIRQEGRRLGLTERQINEQIRANRAQETLSARQITAQQRQAGIDKFTDWRSGKSEDAYDLLDSAMSGGGTRKVTVPVPISDKRYGQILKTNPDADVFYVKGQGAYINQSRTVETPGGGFTDDPAGYNAAYNYLVGAGIPADLSLLAVRGYFNVPQFKPGRPSKSKGYPRHRKPKGRATHLAPRGARSGP